MTDKNFANQLENAYPNVRAPLRPVSNNILVQYRTERSKVSKGGVILPGHSKMDFQHNQIVKIIAIGPLAFHLRNFDNGKPMPFSEGPWFKEGDYARVPLNGVDQVFVEPTADEIKRIKEVSDVAKKNAESLYISEEGLHKGKYVKFGLLGFSDVIAVVNDPLTVLNGH